MGAIQFFGSVAGGETYDFGNALLVNLLSNRIKVPYNPFMDFTHKSFTVTGWVLITNTPLFQNSFVANWNGVDKTEQHWSFMLGSQSPGANTRILTGDTVQFQRANSGRAIDDYERGSWDFRAYQMDLLGVNGEPDMFRIADARINRDRSGVPYTFWGSSYNNDASRNYSFLNKEWVFNGGISELGGVPHQKRLDDIAFYDRALTTEEIKKLYNNGKGFPPTDIPGCVACYHFDEAPGTAVASSAQPPGSPESRLILDASGNGNHAYTTGYPQSTVIDYINHYQPIT